MLSPTHVSRCETGLPAHRRDSSLADFHIRNENENGNRIHIFPKCASVKGNTPQPRGEETASPGPPVLPEALTNALSLSTGTQSQQQQLNSPPPSPLTTPSLATCSKQRGSSRLLTACAGTGAEQEDGLHRAFPRREGAGARGRWTCTGMRAQAQGSRWHWGWSGAGGTGHAGRVTLLRRVQGRGKG